MSTAALNPLVTKVRSQYPGVYDDIDDATLTKKLLAKYPQYSDLAAPSVVGKSGVNPNENALKGVAGYDAVGPIQDTPVTRIGQRIKQNLDVPKQIGAAADAITEGIHNIRTNGPSKLPQFLDALKQYKDPEKLAADLITGYITAGAPDVPTPTAGAEAPPPWWRNPEAAAGDASGAVPTAIKVGKMIPGVSHYAHLADFARKLIGAAGEEPEAPAAPAPPPQAATGPPELWGKRIPDLTTKSAPVPAPPTPQPESASTTPAEPAPPETAQPAAATTKITPKQVGKQLDEALGAEPAQKPVPGVPLRNQPAAMRAAAGKLPEGFTPVDSTALKGYKYTPETREFESITTGGQHYVHGDVSPEEVEAFEGAKSKGQAWQQIRQNPLVAKVVNGQRVAAKPVSRTVVLDPTTNQPEFSDVVSAKTGIPEEDLTDLLQQSLKQIQARKAAQTTR